VRNRSRFGLLALGLGAAFAAAAQIGQESSTYRRLGDGEEFDLSVHELIAIGRATFTAEWLPHEGGGRPLSKGTGAALADSSRPLVFPNNFNRVSAMDSNSCAGCHNQPFGAPGGGGDFVTGVFVAAQRFDFATLDFTDAVSTRGTLDEAVQPVTLQTIGNYRATIGMYGSGYIEMLARQMTEELRSIRDSIEPGTSAPLVSKGVEFGVLRRGIDGNWDASAVEGLPAQSILTAGGSIAPSLIIRPFHQSGSVVSIRQFTNNAFNHHHGMQASERFGDGVDADGDGIFDELTRADITAVTVFQATLPAPGQVLPMDPAAKRAVGSGERLFRAIGCAACHRPALPLTEGGWVYTEPNPYNPSGNLQPDETQPLRIDLTDDSLPGARLKIRNGVVWVPAFTDLKLHDITAGADDPNAEALDINEPGGSPGFLGGNRRFLTKKLWGAANERPYFHHGLFTTLREAVEAHHGEATAAREAFDALDDDERNSIVEFLKSLQILPEPPGHGRR
jgi:hypothetical protein